MLFLSLKQAMLFFFFYYLFTKHKYSLKFTFVPLSIPYTVKVIEILTIISSNLFKHKTKHRLTFSSL